MDGRIVLGQEVGLPFSEAGGKGTGALVDRMRGGRWQGSCLAFCSAGRGGVICRGRWGCTVSGRMVNLG